MNFFNLNEFSGFKPKYVSLVLCILHFEIIVDLEVV